MDMPLNLAPLEEAYVPGLIVYILKGETGYYIGATKRLNTRLCSHRKGETMGSARLGDPARLECIHTYTTPTQAEGASLETLLWRVYRKNQLQNFLKQTPVWGIALSKVCAKIVPTEYEAEYAYRGQAA
jgi:predicted GIY-YIG superfamily endonuclease